AASPFPVPKAGFQARLHFTLPETLARLGQSCRTLCMSGSCRPSLAIRYEKQARVSPAPIGGARAHAHDTRIPGRPLCGLRRTCRSGGQEGPAKAGRSVARPGSPGVDLAGRGWGPTVVTRANVATLFPWVPDSGWPLPLSKPTGWQNGGKMPQKGGKMATFAGKGYVTGYVATPLLSCGCVNCRRMSAARQIATTLD